MSTSSTQRLSARLAVLGMAVAGGAAGGEGTASQSPSDQLDTRLREAIRIANDSAAGYGAVQLYVDDDAPIGGDGSSWETAFDDLQDALLLVHQSTNDIDIHIGQGMYKADRGTGDRAASFELGPVYPVSQSGLSLLSLTLTGGFAGVGAPNPDEYDPASFVSMLSGDLNGDDSPDFQSRDDNSYRVVTIPGTDQPNSGVSIEYLLKGLTIRGGFADNGSDPYANQGAGLYVGEQTPGFWSHRSSIEDCRFVDNWAMGYGGAIASHRKLNISDTQISSNQSQLGGGGIFCGHADCYLFDVQLTENTAHQGAAAFYHYGIESVSFLRVFLAGNTAMGFNQHVIDVRASDLRLEDCLVLGDGTASDETVHFEPYFGSYGSVSLLSCTFVAYDSPVLEILNETNRIHIIGSIFAGSQIGLDWSDIIDSSFMYTDIEIVSNIMLDPPPTDLVMPLIGLVLYDNNSRDPRFVAPIGSSGISHWQDADFRLRPDSPAIDRISRYTSSYSPDLDQADRDFDDPYTNSFPSSSTVDLGCYEFQGRCNAADIALPVGVLNFADLDLFVARFVEQDRAADITVDGVWNYADILLFVDDYIAGCP